MSDVKPCPHCGESRACVEDIDTTQGLKWYVFCYACGATGGYMVTPAKAIEAWNTRADEPVECDCIGGKCSRCGKDLPEPGYTGYEYEGNYCPTCGAKVIGG